jgi:hypothetical protein
MTVLVDMEDIFKDMTDISREDMMNYNKGGEL